jgi:hypothetical protein
MVLYFASLPLVPMKQRSSLNNPTKHLANKERKGHCEKPDFNCWTDIYSKIHQKAKTGMVQLINWTLPAACTTRKFKDLEED